MIERKTVRNYCGTHFNETQILKNNVDYFKHFRESQSQLNPVSVFINLQNPLMIQRNKFLTIPINFLNLFSEQS